MSFELSWSYKPSFRRMGSFTLIEVSFGGVLSLAL